MNYDGRSLSSGRTCLTVSRYSPLAEQFSHQFPSHDLPSVLAKFSLPVSLSEFRNPLAPPVQEVSHRSWEPRNHPPSIGSWFQGPQCAAPLAVVQGMGGALLCRWCMPYQGNKKLAPQPDTWRCFTSDPALRQSQVPPPSMPPRGPPCCSGLLVLKPQ